MQATRIILHHSLTMDNETASWPVIRNFHVNQNGWSDIGYHFGIENLRGQVEILVGRLPDQKGAHCKGNNSDSIGICFVGDFDQATPSAEAWAAGVRLVKYLRNVFYIDTVQGHCELDPNKTCPGKMFDLDKFRKEVGL